jgi:hypothetical protein
MPSHTFTNEKGFAPGDSILAKIMTTKAVSKCLKLHEITIKKYLALGKIPAIEKRDLLNEECTNDC